MLEERADMARNLINAMSTTEGIEGLYIVRSNGVEEAFRDFKTINEVKEEYGEIKPEWTTDHPTTPEHRSGHRQPGLSEELGVQEGLEQGGGRALYRQERPKARLHIPPADRGEAQVLELSFARGRPRDTGNKDLP
jgi:hypothetical protein